MDRRTDWSLQDVNGRMLIIAAALVGTGALVGLAGLSVGFAAVAGAARSWYQRVDLPPNELMKLKWEQAKAAAGASAGAWQETEAKSYVPRRDRS